MHAASACSTQDPMQHCGKNVGVLMRIDVRYVDAVRLQFSNLRDALGFYLIGIDAACKTLQSENADAISKFL